MTRAKQSRFVFGLGLSIVGLTAACAEDMQVSVDEEEIVGGTTTTVEANPWQIALTDSTGFLFCGGSIVNANWVITAQHCVFGGNSNMRVVAGITNQNQQSTGQIRAINGVATFPAYTDAEFGKDVALVHLATPLTLGGTTAQAIPLITAAEAAAGATAVGVLSRVTGWGTTSEGASTTPTQLRTVDVPIVANAVASTEYGETISADQLPAGLVAGGKDSCQGDSGGPLSVVVDGVRKLAGTVSWGNGCARANFVGLYGRVSSFESWISPRTSGTFTSLLSTAVSGARNAFTHRSVTVPAGAKTLSVWVSGGTGDADLYVRQTSQPTTTTFACRPFLTGNNEFCTIDAPAAGTWFVSLNGFSAYSGGTLQVAVVQ